MENLNPHQKITKPQNFFVKLLKVDDLKKLFHSLTQLASHTAFGKWEEVAGDAVEALSALGLQTEPGELGFLLIHRSLSKAIFALVGESLDEQDADFGKESGALLDVLDFTMADQETVVDSTFFDRPENLPLLNDLQPMLRQWFEFFEVPAPATRTISARLPSYFVYELLQESRLNAKFYTPFFEAIRSPFTGAAERQWEWKNYAALLKRRVEEGIFDEPFSLSQLYVPPERLLPEGRGG